MQNESTDANPTTEVAPQIEGGLQKAVGDLTSAGSSLVKGDIGRAFALTENYVMPVVNVLVIVLVSYFVASFVARLASIPIRKRIDETLGRFIGKLIYYLIMLCAILGVLGRYGISVTSFAAVIAAAGFAIGMAFQGTLSNFASGVLLLVFRPFKVGDVVGAAGITAKVEEIDLFTTTFDTPDNRRFIVPNNLITSSIIENISRNEERRVDVSVGCDYSASLDATREVLTAAAESLQEKLVEGEGRGYQVALIDLGDSSVNWTVRFWTKAEDFWAVKEELTTQVKQRLDQAKIGIPFPQMDVHMVPAERSNP